MGTHPTVWWFIVNLKKIQFRRDETYDEHLASKNNSSVKFKTFHDTDKNFKKLNDNNDSGNKILFLTSITNTIFLK